MEMTVREWIREMRKIPSLPEICYINTLNGTKINIPDIRRHGDYISKTKLFSNGELVFRTISCYISLNKNTKGLDLIKQYNIREKYEDSFYCENEYYIPERELNRFISINGGIDEYISVTLHWWMYKDHQEMIEDIIRKDG